MTTTGECRVCGGRFRVRWSDGMIRHHTNKNAPRVGRPRAPRCDGADRFPKTGTVRRVEATAP